MKLSKKLFVGVVAAFSLTAFLWAQNNLITITNLEYTSSKVSKDFENFSVLQISDLHNKQFGSNQKKLLDKVNQLNPDIIVVTGDLIDKRRTTQANMDQSVYFMQEAAKSFPTYFVTGNHEAAVCFYKDLKKDLTAAGVSVLDNRSERISRGGSELNLIGINDILFFNDNVDAIENKIKKLSSNDESVLNVLLSHRPDLIQTYQNANTDLVLTGHTHGGQFYIPFIGGIVDINTNEQARGLISGMHTKENTSIVISRGMGNSSIPIRFLNYPELVLITLKQSS